MTCKLCGGYLIILGDLGALRWYTCESCGMQFNRPSPRAKAKAKRKAREASKLNGAAPR